MCYAIFTIMLLLASMILLLEHVISREQERFGWSCTFTPSEFPPEKVDMGTVRDRLASRGDFI